MKQIKFIYTLLSVVILFLLTACTNDNINSSDPTNQKGEKVTVRLRVSPAGANTMRGTEEWEDKDHATDDEMMNIWTVVAVNEANNIVGIWSCKPEGKPDQEVDDTEEIIKAEFETNKTYRFYSFANIGVDYISEKILSQESLINPPSDDGTVVETNSNIPTTGIYSETYMNNITVQVKGNGFNPTATDNGFGAKGIPMSNVQKFTITAADGTGLKDLIVVRMLAKIKLEITNTSSESVTIESVTLTDITTNTGNNLKLFPKYNNSDNANTMNAVHGDIQPNLNTGTTTEDVTVTVGKIIVSEGKEDIVFYVNESESPTTNEFKHFFLKLKLSKEEGEVTEERYALIDDKNAENYSGKWDYIARNDYRIIPISLDDYKLELIPYDFPAIGVHPASIKEEDGLYTFTFHDYGHFHLVPKVTKFTANGTEIVNYGTAEGYWSLINNTFEDSWKSWDVFGGTEYDNNTGGFYRKDYSDTEDADDAGGVPVWYENTNSPQWSPDGSENYPPFIFGYIADPEDKLTADLKVYHEFSINLYKEGTGAARQMIYRLYMILDTEQMLYRQNGAAPVRHTHGH